MKVQIELELDISAKAIYRDGEIALSVTGSMPLVPGQDRQASATVESGFSEETLELFRAAFEAVIKETQSRVMTVTQVASSEALSVAARMGEL